MYVCSLFLAYDFIRISSYIYYPLQSGVIVLGNAFPFKAYVNAPLTSTLPSATPPIAALSEYLRSRRSIMIGGLFTLLLSQLVLMEARSFAVMCVGRLLEGISSSAVMTAGLALM